MTKTKYECLTAFRLKGVAVPVGKELTSDDLDEDTAFRMIKLGRVSVVGVPSKGETDREGNPTAKKKAAKSKE